MKVNSVNARQNNFYYGFNTRQVKNQTNPSFGYFGNPEIGPGNSWGGPSEFDEQVGEFLGKTLLVISSPIWGPFYGGYKLYQKQRENNAAKIEALATEKADKMFKAEQNRQKTPKELLANFIGASMISNPNKGLNKVMGNGELKLDVHTKILSPIVAVLNGDEDLVKTNSLPNGFVLFGPKGSGKTYFMEALGEHAKELGINFVKPEVDPLDSLQSVKNIRDAFKEAENNFVETGKYTMIFMDEMDTYALDRRLSIENLKEVSALLKLTENSSQRGVIWLGATNNIRLMDRALMDRANMIRPMPLMQNFELFDTLAYHLIKEKGLTNAKDLDYEAIKTKIDSYKNRYSARDIEAIAKEAVHISKIGGKPVDTGIIMDIMNNDIRPTINIRNISEYNEDILYAKDEGFIPESCQLIPM